MPLWLRATRAFSSRLGQRVLGVEAAGERVRLPQFYVSVYSGPEPPSGGVSRPPLAVIAPH